jgi:RimJ/RimL family protein N-acetyltransferase
VGTVGLFGLDSPAPAARLGYWLVAGWRGRGLAREGVGLLAAWAFRELPLRVLHIDVEAGNVASQRLAEALGAHRVGHVEHELRGEPVALTRFALTRAALG